MDALGRGAGGLARVRRAKALSFGLLLLLLLLTLMASGCGGNTTIASTTTAGVTQDAKGIAGGGEHRKFLALVNAICGTVRSGSPAPLAEGAGPEEARGYAISAAEVNEHTIISLRRLGTSRWSRRRLEHLVASLRQLQAAYTQTISGPVGSGGPGSIARSIEMSESQAGVDAWQSGLPSCAPHPHGYGAPSPPPPSHEGSQGTGR